MATYYSNIYGTTIRPDDASSGRVVTFAGSLIVPAGSSIATADIFKLFKVGSGGFVRNIWLRNPDITSGAGPGTFGHYALATGSGSGTEIDADSISADVDFDTAQDRNWENYATDNTSAGVNFATPFGLLTQDASFEVVMGTVTATVTAGGTFLFTGEVVFFGDGTQPVYAWNRTNLGAVST